MTRCDGRAILAACEADETVLLARAASARDAYRDLLSDSAPQYVATDRARRHYESSPSYTNHLAYHDEWAKLCDVKVAVEQAAAARIEALAAHNRAWNVVETIHRLRKASLDVQALGYDPKAFI